MPRCLGCDLENRSPPDHDCDKWDSKQLLSRDVFLFIPPDVNKRLKVQYVTLDPISQPVSWLFSKSRGNVLVLMLSLFWKITITSVIRTPVTKKS